LEDPSVWTVVNPQPDLDSRGVMEEEHAGISATPVAPPLSDAGAGKAPMRPQTDGQAATTLEDDTLGAPLEDFPNQDESDSSDEDFISMRSSSKKSPTPQSPRSAAPPEPSQREPALPDAVSATVTPPSMVREEVGDAKQESLRGSSGQTDPPRPEAGEESEGVGREDVIEDLGDEPPFDFEDDAVGYPPTRVSKPEPQPYLLEEDTEPELVPDAHPAAILSTSPAVPIPQRSIPQVAPSAGSYRGRQITTFDVVKDRRILESAAELGDFCTFVGSVDGRTGADGGDLSSFRASLNDAEYSGTPRSLAERMAMEETHVQRHEAGRR